MPFRPEQGAIRSAPIITIHSPTPEQSYFAKVLSPLEGIVRGYFHWVPNWRGHGELAPCLEEECSWCDKHELRWQAYAPAMVCWPIESMPGAQGPALRNAHGETIYLHRGKWRPGIVRITHMMRPILDNDRRGWILEIFREGKKANSPCAFRPIERYAQPEAVDGAFPVLPILHRIWRELGLMTKAQYERWLAEHPEFVLGGAPMGTAEARAAARTSPPAAGTDPLNQPF